MAKRLNAKQREVLQLVAAGTPWLGVSDLTRRNAAVRVSGRRSTLASLYRRGLITLPGHTCSLTDKGREYVKEVS